MTKVLLYVDPIPLPDTLFRNKTWLTVPLALVESLKSSAERDWDFHLLIPSRFAGFLNPRQAKWFGPHVSTVDEKPLLKAIRDTKLSLREFSKLRFRQPDHPAVKKVVQEHLAPLIGAIRPDLIVSFGQELDAHLSQDRAALHLNMEASPFSRYPFTPSFFLDHCGLFFNSLPSSYNWASPIPDAQLAGQGLIHQLRDRAKACLWQTDNPLRSARLDRFAKTVLLPLQASNYPSFDGQCAYETQTEYLLDACASFSPDMGIVITEHPNAPCLSQTATHRDIYNGLANLFPNVVYLPRAVQFSAGSQLLFPQVDAVWTVASNIAPCARVFGLPVGTLEDTHIAYAATATTPAQLETQIGRPDSTLVGASTPAWMEWMFRHYIIPFSQLQDRAWLSDYLARRIEHFQRFGRSIEAFCSTQLNDVEAFLCGEPLSIQQATLNRTFKQVHIPMLNQHAAAMRRQQSLQLNSICRNSARNSLGQDTARRNGIKIHEFKSYTLLNNTAELEQYNHLGCNKVLATIISEMKARGFHLRDSVNRRGEMPQSLPDLVLINGEGSLHNNSRRGKMLLQAANQMARQGAKVALINSVWEENNADFVELIRGFNLVCVREHRSARQLAKWNIQARVVPDLSFAAWNNQGDDFSGENVAHRLFTDSVHRNRSRKLYDASLIFGGGFIFLDGRKIQQFSEDGFISGSETAGSTPLFWSTEARIAAAGLVVTGRFHVAAACIAYRTPFVFVDSNTAKIQAMCQDARLPELLNVTESVDAEDWDRLGDCMSAVKRLRDELTQKMQAYEQHAKLQIKNLFNTLAHL